MAGVPNLPELSLDGYAAFKMEGAQGALMVGELPLLESEVNPVIDTLEAGGIHLTAMHNHFIFEYPRMIFVHMDGVGDPVQMAKVVESAIRKTGIPRVNDDNQTDADDVAPGLDTNAIDAILGHSGEAKDAVYQVTVYRAEDFTDRGLSMPSDMGPEVELHFQPLFNGRRSSTGSATAGWERPRFQTSRLPSWVNSQFERTKLTP